MKSFWLLLLDCNFVVSHTKQEKRHLHVYVGTRSCQEQPLQCGILLDVGYIVVGHCLMTDCDFHLWSLALAMYLQQANTKVSSQIAT